MPVADGTTSSVAGGVTALAGWCSRCHSGCAPLLERAQKVVTLHGVHGKPLLTGRRSLSSLAAHFGAKQPSPTCQPTRKSPTARLTPRSFHTASLLGMYRIDGILCFLGLLPAPRAMTPHEPSETGRIRCSFSARLTLLSCHRLVCQGCAVGQRNGSPSKRRWLRNSALSAMVLAARRVFLDSQDPGVWCRSWDPGNSKSPRPPSMTPDLVRFLGM